MADVWLHIYHCDPCTGFLNQAFLKNKEIGIYHAGIEVFGEEWSFMYFEDTWDKPSVSGLIRCQPKTLAGFQYQESVNLGPTPLSKQEVNNTILRLHAEWPASSYHLTNKNCLVFSECFAQILRTPTPFPSHLKGILDASKQNASVDAMVDKGWALAKWWMLAKNKPSWEANQFLCNPLPQPGSGVWGTFCHPTQNCCTAHCRSSPAFTREGSLSVLAQ